MRMLLISLLALPLALGAQAGERYQRALALADSQAAIDARDALPAADSVLLTHGHRTGRAVVFFHGFTNSPRQWSAFAQDAFAGGANVWIPRLPRHGAPSGDVRSLSRIRAAELARIGELGAAIGAGLADTVVVVGMSAGGVVAAWVAQHVPVAQVMLVSPAFALARVPAILDAPVRELAARLPDLSHRDPTDTTRRDQSPGWTTHGTAEFLRLGAAVRASADRRPAATQRITLVVNSHDASVRSSAALDLLGRWRVGGADVEAFEFPDSLRLPHDLVDPREPGADTARVYPQLRHLLRGDALAPWLATLDP